MLPKVARHPLRIAALVGFPLAVLAQTQCSDNASTPGNNTTGSTSSGSTTSGAGGDTTGSSTSTSSGSMTTSSSTTGTTATSGAGGSTGAGGSATTGGSSGSTGATGGSAGAGGNGGTGGAGGSSGGAGGTGAGGKGGAGGSGGGAGGAGGSGGGPMNFTPCTSMPAAMPPALKKGPAIGPFAAQAGQIIGVPGEPDLLYVIGHRNGNVYVVQGTTVAANPLVHVDIATAGNNEQGLLSMALHPNFATNHLFYLYYPAAADGSMTIDEFERTSPTAATKKQNIYSHARADGACASGNCFHNGGMLQFNPKDASPYLYLSVGNNTIKAQSSSATGYAGRVLRFDLGTKMSTTFAYGLRNPYRMSIDPLTGDMWIGDVADGPGGSVFYIANGSAPGKDFGYGDGGEIAGGISDLQTGSAALIGGFVYRGNAIPGLCGRYLFGMHDPGTVRSMIQQNGQRVGGIVNIATLSVPNKLSSFGQDGVGELYVASMGDNVIYKIIAGP
jgi:Glucose / Sorbosone dehydrogenase